MKNTIQLVIIGIIALLIGMAYKVPAHFVISKLPPNPSIKIAGVSGTLWQGSASQIVVNQLSLGKVTWNANPLSLITTRLKTYFDFKGEGLNGSGVARIGRKSLTLEETKIFARSDALHPALVKFFPSLTYTGTQLSGQMDLDLELLKATHEGPQDLQGILLWQTAGFSQPAPISLGNISAKLGFQENQAIANIDNAGGELEIRGNARMEQGWNYSTDILVTPNQNTPEAISNSLPILGEPDRNGSVRLQNEGVLEVRL